MAFFNRLYISSQFCRYLEADLCTYHGISQFLLVVDTFDDLGRVLYIIVVIQCAVQQQKVYIHTLEWYLIVAFEIVKLLSPFNSLSAASNW
jgi:hypothetical protein